MKAPGVEVRPLKQLTGSSEFNQVFFADVRLPMPTASARWATMALPATTLVNQRVALRRDLARPVSFSGGDRRDP